MNVKSAGYSSSPRFRDVAMGADGRVRDVVGEKFYLGLMNGSLMAIALWVALFLLIRA